MGTKILSIPYLGKELDVDFTEVSEDGKVKEVISHASLMRIINNECMNATYHYTQIVLGEVGHYAATCAISDSSGKRVEGVGESTPATLTSSISRDYPVLMAYKRAFDNAANAFLGLDNDLYSDSQIIPTDNTPVKREKPASAPVAKTEKPAEKPAAKPAARKTESPVEDDGAVLIDIPDESEPDVGFDTVVGTPDEDMPYDEPEDPSTVGQNDHDDRFDIPVTIGRHKSEGLTIAQLAQKDLSSLKWIADLASATGDKLAQKEAALAWFAAHPEAGEASA